MRPPAPRSGVSLVRGHPKVLQPYHWDRHRVPAELKAFRELLAANAALGESSDLSPFFRERPALCGFLAMCCGNVYKPDGIAFEFSLGGSYRPDFVVTDRRSRSVLFVEIEDGGPSSFFSRRSLTRPPKLGHRLLNAMSQVFDWAFQLRLLSDEGLQNALGFMPIECKFLIVAGRGTDFRTDDECRYNWVSKDRLPPPVETAPPQTSCGHAGPSPAPPQPLKELPMRFMILVKATADSEAGALPSTELLTQMGQFNEALVKAGVMVAGEGLHPSSRGARVRFSGKDRRVIDGPFAETKELVAGYWIWECASMDEAISWVRRCPNPMPGDSEIEIRQIFGIEDFGDALTPELREQEDRLRAQTGQTGQA